MTARTARGGAGVDRDPLVPDTSDDWYLIGRHNLGPCGAVIRDETGQLQRGCIFWASLTLVEGRWLCSNHVRFVASDPTRYVFPISVYRQAVLL